MFTVSTPGGSFTDSSTGGCGVGVSGQGAVAPGAGPPARAHARRFAYAPVFTVSPPVRTDTLPVVAGRARYHQRYQERSSPKYARRHFHGRGSGGAQAGWGGRASLDPKRHEIPSLTGLLGDAPARYHACRAALWNPQGQWWCSVKRPPWGADADADAATPSSPEIRTVGTQPLACKAINTSATPIQRGRKARCSRARHPRLGSVWWRWTRGIP